MKSALPLAALLFGLMSGTSALAQVDTYTFAPSSGTYTPLPATATDELTVLADDNVSSAITLPFSFIFDGTAQTQVIASSNGFLSFAPTPALNGSNSFNNNLLTAAANNRPLVAAFWDDLDGRTTGARASYFVSGTAPNRVFTFEWLNWNRYSNSNGPAGFSFQVKLFETTNVVQTVYRQESSPVTGTPSASIGLAGLGTGIGSFLSLSDASAAPTVSSVADASITSVPGTGQVYTFTPTPVTGCPPARSVFVSNVTGTSAQLNFGGNSNATSYTVVLTPQGGTPTTLTPAPTAAPVPLTNLTVNTTYTVSVTPVCASGTAAPVTITFSTSNGYCVTGSGTTVLGGVCGGSNVTDVVLSNTTLNATGLTCSSPVAGTAYTNYPRAAPTTGTVQINVPFTISATTSGTSIVSAWIDWNRNLDFEASEWVQLTASSTAGTAATVTYTIPNTAAGGSGFIGTTGMRIRSRAAGNANGAIDACTQFFSGETKDFTITIAPEPTCLQANTLGATGLTTTTASLTFNAVGAGTYAVVYGPLGFNPAATGGGGTTLSSVTSPVAVTGLQPGTTYQFYVVRTCLGAAGSSIFAGPFAFTTVIANDDPCGAIVLPMNANGCVAFGSTTAGATRTVANGYVNPGMGCGPNSNPLDVWFRFTTDATGLSSTTARIRTTSTAANVASAIQAFSASTCNGPFTLVACGGAANATATSLDLTGLSASTTYYVRVFSFSPANPRGAFTICVTPLPGCPTPTAQTALNITKNSALLSWTAGAGGIPPGSTYSVIYGGPGFNPNTAGTTVTGITGTSYQLGNLAVRTDYCYYIRFICGGINGNSTLVGPFCFQTLLEAPANDEPCSADVLPLTNAPTTGSNIGATQSAQPGLNASLPACGPTTLPRDVWYVLAGAAAPNNALTFSLTGIAAGMLRVYESPSCAAGPFAMVFCRAATASNIGFGGTPFTMTNVIPGRTYYVAVSNFGDADVAGAFTLRVQPSFVAPPCNAVTSLAAASTSAVSGSVSFVPGLNNTSFTVSYAPTAGGAPVVVAPAPAASPVVLAGLLPSTAYTVTVTPVCASGGTSTASTTTFTTPAPPPCNAVTNLVAGSVTGTSASVSFTPGLNNTSFTVNYTPAGGTPITVTPAPAASPVALTGLLSNTTYSVSVTPVCASGGTAPATLISFTTSPAACGAATGLAATNIGTTGATIGFTPGVNNTTYTVTYAAAGGSPVTVSPTPTASPVVLAGLVPATQYTVSITPVCAIGGGVSSASTVSFTTLTPVCNAVSGVAVGSITTTAASVSFVPGTNNTSYTVTYAPIAGGPSTTVPATASPVALTGLSASIGYTVTVTAFCALGGPTPAAPVTFATPAPPVCNPVSNIVVSNLTNASASIGFTPGTNNTSFTVSYAPTVGGPAVTVTPAPTASPAALTGLLPNTAYTVTITPVCAAGGTAPAATGTFTTLATPCGAVTNLAAQAAAGTSVTVSFTPGINNVSYTVTYVPAAGGTSTTVSPAPTASPVVIAGLQPGIAYTITVTPTCGAGTNPASSTSILYTLLSSRSHFNLGQLQAYPNPAHDRLTVVIPAGILNRQATIELVNALGQVMKSQATQLTPATPTNAQLALSGLATGLYLVRVRAGADTGTVRVVVE